VNSLNKSTLRNYALALVGCVVVVVAAQLLFKTADPVEEYLQKTPDKQEVLGLFQSKAQLATTEVTLRRMGIYDSETRLATINPANWRLGRRACIMPVDMTIKYGVDMRKLTAADIVIDTSNVVRIHLPEPEVIDYHVEMRTDRREVVTMSGWLRDEVGEQTMQTIKNKVVEEVMADSTLFNSLRTEIQGNTRAIFRSMLQQMGLKPVFTN
jgi:translation initiation factor 1 (eIF-1/SUI1)